MVREGGQDDISLSVRGNVKANPVAVKGRNRLEFSRWLTCISTLVRRRRVVGAAAAAGNPLVLSNIPSLSNKMDGLVPAVGSLMPPVASTEAWQITS